MTDRILIVDDEIDLVRLVKYNLDKEGFEVITAYDGQTGLNKIKSHAPDLVVLDLMLPDMSGIQICQQAKRDPKLKDIPVIMLTARSSESDRVAGFESGADDYVVKPFSPKELVLRVKALLHRTRNIRSAPPSQIHLGKLIIYPHEHSVELASGQPISLSSIEFRLLLTLAQSPNRVKTREQLIEAIWEEGGDNINDRAVDTQIKRLRQKLGEARDVIETIRGVGYRAISSKGEYPTTKALS